MNVKLIAVTQPRIQKDEHNYLNAEELIIYAARVSNPSNQMSHETAPKLIKYCLDHEHWSVFETASMTVEIVTSRAISAQILRHRSFTFQEFSQRYAEVTAIEPVELRKKADKNRQSSTGEFKGIVWAPYVEFGMPYENIEANRAVKRHCEMSLALYDNLVRLGVATECARMVLPMATRTTLYMTGNVRSWIHYLMQRTKEDTQKEHREVALAIKEIFTQEFPVISSAIFNNELT